MRTEQDHGKKGSLRWIQRLVEYDSDRFAGLLREAGALAADVKVDWKSPRVGDGWAEYRDGAFLEKLGLAHLADSLRGYWPANGPQWDALGRASDGRVFLVEAKAHVGELASKCGAVSATSLERIDTALNSTRATLGARASSNWMEPYYQYANRLAHLQFLKSHGVDATLVFVYFTGDIDMPEPRDHGGFHRAIGDVHDALGFPIGHSIPDVVDIFLDVSDIRGSADNPERHPSGYDHRARFPEQRVVAEMEGGTVMLQMVPKVSP